MCLPTGELPTVPSGNPPSGDRGVMMPKRRRNKTAPTASDAERALNAADAAERNRPPPFSTVQADSAQQLCSA